MDNLPSKEESLEILIGKRKISLDVLMEVKYSYSKELTFSRNVFIPLTRVCRNRCGYCTFRRDVAHEKNVMGPSEVHELAKRADGIGCHEVLFTYGERADENQVVKDELEHYGFDSMTSYVYELSEKIVERTNMLVHTNAGLLKDYELKKLRDVTASMGLMLESSSVRLMGMVAHRESPGKEPQKRKDMIRRAGKLRIPFTTGLLIGIGETDEEIYRSLMDIRRIQDRYGHIQEIIVQNFVPKSGTPMAHLSGPGLQKICSVLTLARLIFPDVAIQLPPNLNSDRVREMLPYGIDDLGGISPISIDHVNPESPWPLQFISELGLRERLPVYPRFIDKGFLSDTNYRKALDLIDGSGYARD